MQVYFQEARLDKDGQMMENVSQKTFFLIFNMFIHWKLDLETLFLFDCHVCNIK